MQSKAETAIPERFFLSKPPSRIGEAAAKASESGHAKGYGIAQQSEAEKVIESDPTSRQTPAGDTCLFETRNQRSWHGAAGWPGQRHQQRR
jgi:hypothetical protein